MGKKKSVEKEEPDATQQEIDHLDYIAAKLINVGGLVGNLLTEVNNLKIALRQQQNVDVPNEIQDEGN